jgi:hypothetical protein
VSLTAYLTIQAIFSIKKARKIDCPSLLSHQ